MSQPYTDPETSAMGGAFEFLRCLVDWVRRKKTGANPRPESTFCRLGTGASVGKFRVEGGAAQGFNRTFDIEGRLDVGAGA